MKKSIKAETFVSIVVVVIILSFTALGILSILNFDKDVSGNFSKNTDRFILKSNNENIIKKSHITNIAEKEIFYLYKNSNSKIYEIFTGSTNESYKYINSFGEKKSDNKGEKFIRTFVKTDNNILVNIK